MPALTNTDMVTGIGRARGIKNIEPEDVAAAVAGLIRKPRPRVMVPRTFGAIALTGRRLLPRPAYESLERALGAERVFQDSVDPSLRTAYERRIRNS